jgi:hypothetical protein
MNGQVTGQELLVIYQDCDLDDIAQLCMQALCALIPLGFQHLML